MLLCIAAAVLVGVLGNMLPEKIQDGMADYLLHFLSDSYMNLLNTFIGPMIFLSIVTGICGFGRVAAFGKAGRLMMTRFVSISFLISGLYVIAMRLLFPLMPGDSDGGSISCLSVLIVQMGIPQEAVAIGATATIFLDFLTTSSRIFIAHLETLLQADRLGLLKREILQQK